MRAIVNVLVSGGGGKSCGIVWIEHRVDEQAASPKKATKRSKIKGRIKGFFKWVVLLSARAEKKIETAED